MPPTVSSPLDDLKLDEWLGRNLRRATNAVFLDFAEKFGDYQIRPALFAVLAVIEKHPGSSGARLSELLDIPRANMVLLLRELEQRKLISRKPDPANRRAHIVHLSQAGETLMTQLHAAHARHIEAIDGMLSPEELKFLLALLQRIWKQAGAGLDTSD